MTERLFKVLNEDGSACHGGHGTWHLPESDRPGDWMPIIEGELIPCKNGYHLCREQDLVHWLGEAIFEVEYRGEQVDSGDKIVVREARLLRRCENWNERTARLFACDCAEHVLHIFEQQYPGHNQPRHAIETSRKYAGGNATKAELAAAGAAARTAAGAGPRDAAGAAAGAAARAAARAAPRAAAGAGAAARDAAAEREWQTSQLMQLLYPGA